MWFRCGHVVWTGNARKENLSRWQRRPLCRRVCSWWEQPSLRLVLVVAMVHWNIAAESGWVRNRWAVRHRQCRKPWIFGWALFCNCQWAVTNHKLDIASNITLAMRNAYVLVFHYIKWSCRMQNGLLCIVKHLRNVVQCFSRALDTAFNFGKVFHNCKNMLEIYYEISFGHTICFKSTYVYRWIVNQIDLVADENDWFALVKWDTASYERKPVWRYTLQWIVILHRVYDAHNMRFVDLFL